MNFSWSTKMSMCMCTTSSSCLYFCSQKKKSCLYFFCLLPWAVTLLCFSLATLPLFLFLFFIFLFFFFWLSPGRPFFFFCSWQHCPFFLGSNVASSFFLFSFSIFFFFFSRAWRDIFFFFFFLTRHGFWKYIYKFGWLLFFCGYLSFFLF